MGETRLDHCCRLCLKEGFSLTNIFAHRSAAGDPLYLILNFIYEMKIFENDGLPSQICSPCMWRMIEFDACKKNVRSAEAEIMRLLNQTRPPPVELQNDSLAAKAEMDEASEVGVQCDTDHYEVPMKEEFDILEIERPIETYMKETVKVNAVRYVQNCNEKVFCEPLRERQALEAVEHFEDDVGDTCHDLDSTEEELVKIEAAESEQGMYNERISSEQFTKSSQLPEVPTSDCDDAAGRICLGESSSVNTAPENNVRIRDIMKRTSERDLRDDFLHAQESLSAEEPKSVLNDTEPGPSFLTAPLSKMKNQFICDICKKGFVRKILLGSHIRIHYDERLFCCGVCGKGFKQDRVRYNHELRHLKVTMSFGKSEKGSMKKQFSCGICGRNFGSRKGLNCHLNQHSNKYLCRTCGKSFGNNTDLKNHLRVHTKEKPYECTNCFKSFNLKTNLTKHLVTHSSDKPFACDVCKKKFKTKESKTRHELLHVKKK